jgi:II/X family phage/plasmid replication protein
LIDWLTLSLPRERVSGEDWSKLSAQFSKILMIDPEGNVTWEKLARESIRSDSHQIVVEPGYSLVIMGSPARVVHRHNVWGDGCPQQCARDMIWFVNRVLGLDLPPVCEWWDCRRIDITHNYDLGGVAEVRQALLYLRHAEGGHRKVNADTQTVYWNMKSKLRQGKAYAKGEHLRYQDKKKLAVLEGWEIELGDRLLRLELSLKSQYWREHTEKLWYEFTEDCLDELHEIYFRGLIGTMEVVEMDSLRQRIIESAETEGRGLAAYTCWALIKTVGREEARASMSKTAWYRNLSILKIAGLTDADFQAQNIVPFRRRVIELGQPVRSWADMKRVA